MTKQTTTAHGTGFHDTAGTERPLHDPLVGVLRRNAARDPDRPAFVDRAGSCTWGQLLQDALRSASAIAARGAQQPMGLFMGNHTGWIRNFVAIQAAGAAVVPINRQLREEELRRIVEAAGISTIITDPEHRGVPEAVARATRLDVLVEGEGFSWSAEVRGHVPLSLTLERPGGRPAIIFFTSGTTGEAKGVVHTYSSGIIPAPMEMALDFGFNRDDVTAIATPLYHIAGLGYGFLAPVLGGARCVILEHFDAERFLVAVARHRVTYAFLVPTQVQAVLDLVAAGAADRYDLSSWRLLLCASTRVGGELREAARKMLPDVALTVSYGSSETWGVTRLPADVAPHAPPHSVGTVCLQQEVRLVDDHGHDVPTGAVGEIWVRGPAVMRGYLGSDGSEFRDGGWFPTGDLGRFDHKGFLEVVGRTKDVIITGGVNVYPAEVEAALLGDQRVEQCTVVGLPDSKWGERVTAFIVTHFDLSDDQLDSVCSDLASYKRPKQWIVVDSLPRNTLGKIDKQRIIEMFSER